MPIFQVKHLPVSGTVSLTRPPSSNMRTSRLDRCHGRKAVAVWPSALFDRPVSIITRAPSTVLTLPEEDKGHGDHVVGIRNER